MLYGLPIHTADPLAFSFDGEYDKFLFIVLAANYAFLLPSDNSLIDFGISLNFLLLPLLSIAFMTFILKSQHVFCLSPSFLLNSVLLMPFVFVLT
jgi:hypothetical protein